MDLSRLGSFFSSPMCNDLDFSLQNDSLKPCLSGSPFRALLLQQALLHPDHHEGHSTNETTVSHDGSSPDTI